MSQSKRSDAAKSRRPFTPEVKAVIADVSEEYLALKNFGGAAAAMGASSGRPATASITGTTDRRRANIG